MRAFTNGQNSDSVEWVPSFLVVFLNGLQPKIETITLKCIACHRLFCCKIILNSPNSARIPVHLLVDWLFSEVFIHAVFDHNRTNIISLAIDWWPKSLRHQISDIQKSVKCISIPWLCYKQFHIVVLIHW